MPGWLQGLIAALGCIPALLAMAILAGLGLHREAAASAIATSTVAIVLGPPILAALLVPQRAAAVFGGVAAGWGALIITVVPVYFPGERDDALVTGLSLGSNDLGGMARAVTDAIPPGPDIAEPETPVAESLVAQPAPAPATRLAAHEIALPYEGDGRRLSIEVAVEHGDEMRELQLLLDTGATYTTLPASILRDLGVRPDPDAPVLTLHTAAGEREARVVLIDRLWLGDLPTDGVAIAVCDACASDDTAGLLGLNVTGGYNLNIDADRHEVVFSRRAAFSRHLDIKPFIDVGATVRRLSGRVSVEASLTNDAPRTVESARTSIHCREETWLVDLGPAGPGEEVRARSRLPRHEPCERYQVGLHSAHW